MGKKRSRKSHQKSSKKQKMSTPSRVNGPLPVTILSGFLGAGKTTLMKHVLTSDHGLRIAVVVNDIGAVNVDASLIKQTHRVTKQEEKIIALQNGCICCTLRGDLLEELYRLSKLQEFDYVLIESSGISEPEQVAETFDPRLVDTMETIADSGEEHGLDGSLLETLKAVKSGGGLSNFAKLDTCVTVIDAFTMLNDFDTDQLISSRRDDVVAEDERTVTDLMVDQIEFANVIILNKIDAVDEDTRSRLMDLAKRLNPGAKIIPAKYGKIAIKDIINTGLFDFEKAKIGPGWLQDIWQMSMREMANGKKTITPKPETEEYSVRNFVYHRFRPFHPERLWRLVYEHFIVQQVFDDDEEEEESDEESDNDEDHESIEGTDEEADKTIIPKDAEKKSSKNRNASETKSASDDDSSEGHSGTSSPRSAISTIQTIPSPVLAPKATAKEEDEEDELDDLTPPPNSVILKNRRAHPVFARLFRSKGSIFLATRPNMMGMWSQAGAMLTVAGEQPWFATMDDETLEDIELLSHDLKKGGEWGDRRQEIVFIGEKLEYEAVEKLFDACLLNDEEWEQWQEIMRNSEITDEEKEEALGDLFLDGFPEWDMDDEEEEGHEGHDHSHQRSGLRNISDYLEQTEA